MFWPGELEIRKRSGGGRAIRGKFPYNKRAVLSDGGNKGRPVKEVIKPGAFKYRLEDPTADIHLLVGHSYDKPLASRLTDTLTFEDTPTALFFEALITEAVLGTSYAEDTLALIGAGLIVGLSPGFRVPPKQTVPDAETIEDEDPEEGRAIIRTLNDVLLYELSIVTSPAYKEASVETDTVAEKRSSIIVPQYRWRHV